MKPWWEFSRERGVFASRVLGIDEAGAGPLAGPVVVAGVILPKQHGIRGIHDSKILKPTTRKELYLEIQNKGEVFVEKANPVVIDREGILVCIKRLMRKIVLASRPEFVLTDAVPLTVRDIPFLALTKGDTLVDSIAAASIVAKVVRDGIMIGYDLLHQNYGFARHKGYGTVCHRRAIRQFGTLKIHRKSFCRNLR